WPDPLEPAAPEGGRGAEQHEEQRVHPAEIKLAPVAARGEERLQRACRLFAKGGRGGRAFGNRLAVGGQERTLQRLPEHAEAIGHADAKVDGESCRRDKPAVIVGGSDNPLFVEQSEMITYGSRSRHRIMT